MKIKKIPALYRETWSVYEAFRKLGFKDDDISHVSAPIMLANGMISKEDWISVVLTVQGKTFTVNILPLDRSYEQARDKLEEVRLAIRERRISDTDLQRMWDESRMGKLDHFTEFATAVIAKGFVIPALTN